jgi:hypothetical protein
VEPEGIEPSTSPQPTERSPTELRSHDVLSTTRRAAARVRTGDLPLTRRALFHLSYDGIGEGMAGFEPAAFALAARRSGRLSYIPGDVLRSRPPAGNRTRSLSDLQSDAFPLGHGRRGDVQLPGRDSNPRRADLQPAALPAELPSNGEIPAGGFEPPNRSSMGGVLYRLSYAGEKGRPGGRNPRSPACEAGALGRWATGLRK